MNDRTRQARLNVIRKSGYDEREALLINDMADHAANEAMTAYQRVVESAPPGVNIGVMELGALIIAAQFDRMMQQMVEAHAEMMSEFGMRQTDVITASFSQPTPGCYCPACETKRERQARMN